MYSAERLMHGCLDAMLALERMRADMEPSHASFLCFALSLAEYNEQNRCISGFWPGQCAGLLDGARAYYRTPGIGRERVDRIMRSLVARLVRFALDLEAVPHRRRDRTLALLLMLHQGLLSAFEEESCRRFAA